MNYASGSLHHGSLDDYASSHILPRRHQQLARQRDDGRLLKRPPLRLTRSLNHRASANCG